jgi:hypothetical protein
MALRFEDWQEDFYFLPDELKDFHPWQMRLIRDCSRYLVAEGWRLLLFRPEAPNSDALFQTPSHVLHLDTARLFKTMLALREKRVETGLDAERFRSPVQRTALLTVTAMNKHPNARGAIAPTLKFFRDRLRAGEWPRLVETVSRFLPQAQVWGHRDEFYFDGRFRDGLGFNGGIILHGNEFSVHT